MIISTIYSVQLDGISKILTQYTIFGIFLTGKGDRITKDLENVYDIQDFDERRPL